MSQLYLNPATLTSDSVVTCWRLDDPFNTACDIVLGSEYAANSLAHEYRQPCCVGQEDTDDCSNDDGEYRRGPHMGRLVGEQEACPCPDRSEEYDREGNAEEGVYGGLNQMGE
jgi:hypothetical protein